MVDEIKINIKGDSTGFQKAANDAAGSVGKISSKLPGVLKLATLAAAGIAAIGTAIGFTISKAAKFEDIGVQFEVLAGSAEKAFIVLEDLKKFSAGTPFQFEEIANAGKLLLAFGTNASDVKEEIRQIGDVSAATGASLGEVATIYGQVSVAGKLTGERLNQLAEKGINIGPAIAKVFKVSESQVKDLVSKGVVSAEKFKQAFSSLSEVGGIAFGGLAKKSATLNGKLSTLGDNWDLLVAAIGKKFIPIAKDVTDVLTGWVRSIGKIVSGPDLAEKLSAAAIQSKKLADEQTRLNKVVKAEGLTLWTTQAEKMLATTKKEIVENDKLVASLTALKAKRDAAATDTETPETTKQQVELANLEAFNDQKYFAESDLQEKLAELDDLSANERIAKIIEWQELEKEQKAIAKEEELAAKGEHEKALDLFDARMLEKAKKTAKGETAIAKLTAKEKQAILVSSLGQIASLQSSSNKALIAVGKAAGIAQAIIATNVGAAEALKLGPLIGIPLAGAIYAAGAVNVANIAGVKGFEDGGIIGSQKGIPTGATSGGDDRLFRGRKGELVLTAQDQGELLEAIRGGNLGGGESNNVEIVLTMNDNLMDFIDAQVIERNAIGV